MNTNTNEKLIRWIFLLTLLVTALPSLGATRTLKGNLTDLNDEPIVGASIIVQNTSIGCMTDIDGDFTLSVPDETITLVISCIGYETKKVEVPVNQSSVKIQLIEDALLLEETVVVGYGTQKKVNLTGAVTSVGGKELENRVSHSLTNMLQGLVPGLNIGTSSGVPGTSPSINIRGTTSINSTDPLVLIDGVEGDLTRVNPNDVQSISVIKDASAAAIYGARAAFGVILVTTKTGSENEGKATVRYSGRVGWEEPTTSTDYINTGYWSVYIVNKFYSATYNTNYINYTDQDMMELLARVNDKTENPDRPWVVEDVRGGRNQWVYYGNYDWYDMNFSKRRPTTQHNVSISGGNKDVKYYVSGGFDWQQGILKQNPDIFRKYNLRSKIDFKINKWASFSENTSLYSSQYEYLGDGSVENTLAYMGRHALACFPQKNPDGSWVYYTDYTSYAVGNGRHIIIGSNSHRNVDRATDVSTTSRLTLTPLKQLTIVGDFSYRFYQTRNTSRSQNFSYRVRPDADLGYYTTGAGEDRLDESISTRNYFAYNVYGTYADTFNGKHNLKVTLGFNDESWKRKIVSVAAGNLASSTLDDLNLATSSASDENYGGGQSAYHIQGIFGRVNYDYEGRYLFELSSRYDGTSRFERSHRWGFFPSASLGWRISEEKFFEPLADKIQNLKLRLSYGSLGNQNVSGYYNYIRTVSLYDFSSFSFGDGSVARYSSLGAPVASDLTWEKAEQYNLGVDYGMFGNRLNFTADFYIRDTKDMLTDGIALPSVYGASVPQMNTADLRTKGYEISVNWNDNLTLFSHNFSYNLGFNISQYDSEITKFDNPSKLFDKDYYVGMKLGEIWGFKTDGLFQTDEEAAEYTSNLTFHSDLTSNLTGGWMAGDVKFLDLNGDGLVNYGSNSADDPGDRTIIGNSLPRLQYGATGGFNYFGFDFNIFFQGTGNHYWYPSQWALPFWGCYSYAYNSFIRSDFLDDVWSEDNPDAYFPRARSNMASGGYLRRVNDRYLQNVRYLRLKSLTFGYTLPANLTKKAGMDQVRIYFSGENLAYWSALKSKYIDPEGALNRSNSNLDTYFYPWSKTFMFGIDVTF